MGCCNEPVAPLTGTAPDPGQHVHYARGMVLGVDDFTQEFAYLEGRTRWLARDAIGYGTASGLRLAWDVDGAQGPRLRVGAGSALTPSGRHLCVAAEQCCVLNRWLERPENAALVNQLLNPVSPPVSPPLSPPAPPAPGFSGLLDLYLTLCWADCLTRPVPIPGEPCRDASELMAPSRVADDYRLELRASPPQQTEDDALRDYVRWLTAHVQVQDSSPPPAGDAAAWRDALRQAAQPWLAAAEASPPQTALSSPPVDFATLGDYLFDPSPSPAVLLAPDQVADFLALAQRFWVTELRPLWAAQRCHRVMHADSDCLLLARVGFEVTWVGGSPSGAWQVSGSPLEITLDESTRPLLSPLRALQALLPAAWARGSAAQVAATGPGLPVPLNLRPPPAQPDSGGNAVPAEGAESAAAAAPAGPAPAANPAPAPTRPDPGPGRLPVLRTRSALQLGSGHGCVIADGGESLALTLPASTPATAGQVLVLKNTDLATLTLQTDPATQDHIDGQARLIVKKRRAATLVADGAGGWAVISQL